MIDEIKLHPWVRSTMAAVAILLTNMSDARRITIDPDDATMLFDRLRELDRSLVETGCPVPPGNPTREELADLKTARATIRIMDENRRGEKIILQETQDINREQAARILFLEDSLKTASMYVTQAIGEVDDIFAARPQTYANPDERPFNAVRTMTMKDAKPKAKRAAAYLRQAWDILDPRIV